MPIKTQLWTVAENPTMMNESKLPSEKVLEQMIVRSPEMLSEEWMLIGQQVPTTYGGIVDLLAIARDGSLVMIELKRDQTPREVVAQALDYASWTQQLQPQNITSIYSKFKPDSDLATDFNKRFGAILDDESLNQSHQVIIVASTLDLATERIVAYLSNWNIPINVLLFQVFEDEGRQVLGRTWLLDPAETQVNSVNAPIESNNEPWNGEYYCSFGQSHTRSWDEAMKHGFVSADGGSWYSNTLKRLEPGKRIWVNAIGSGYVGVGIVTGHATPAREFFIETPEGRYPALEILRDGTYHKEYLEDDAKCARCQLRRRVASIT